jgi:hypothetical protein
MIRLGLRLALASGREALVRLIVIGLAVTIGTGLLLATLAGINAVHDQNARFGWLNSAIAPAATTSAIAGPAATTGAAAGPAATTGADPLWWSLREDYFRGETIARVDVAALGPRAPVPPGVPRLPGPGEFYASPALDKLLRTTPAAQLGDRFPGHEIGVIGAAALPSPDTPIALVGGTPAEVAKLPFARRITEILTVDPGTCNDCYVGIPSAGLNLILGVVAAALLFPVLMFIGTATRLAATRREERFAAMRLVGATPRQISVVAAVEAAAAAIAGMVLGFGLFLALRTSLAGIPFTGARFFPGDIRLTVVDVLAVAIGVPLGAVVAARLALRRVRISPLGVTRRVTPRPPRATRLILLAAGVAELLVFLGVHPDSSNGQIVAYLSGMFLIMVGLVVAGPWLTMLGSRVLARRAGRAETLIAGRRLADNPKVAFRAVSGLMLALFVTTVATGIITTFVANRSSPDTDTVARTSLHTIAWPDQLADGQAPPRATDVPAGLATIPGVSAVQVVYTNPGWEKPDVMPGLVACAGLPPAFGTCRPGGEVAAVYPDLVGIASNQQATAIAAPTWDTASFTVDEMRKLPLLAVVVLTDGSPAALEQSRTVLEAAFPLAVRPPASDNDFQNDATRSLVRFQQLAAVVILASLPIAGCSLAVSVAGGLTERKRPFSMLRLTGMRLAELRRVVLLESAVPLMVVAVLAIGTGFLAAELFLRSQLHYTLVWPGGGYAGVVVAGLALSLAIIISTMPLLRRITGPETARNE